MPLNRLAWAAPSVNVGLLAVVAVSTVILYNSLVSKRNQVEGSFAQIEVQLKKRYDLVPNLVETVKGYARHERDTLEQVIRLRNAAVEQRLDTDHKILQNNAFSKALGALIVRMEAYPDLKANENYLMLMRSLNDIEEQISAARRFFNSATEQYNNAVQMFPSNLVAGAFAFRRKPYFEVDSVERRAIRVALGQDDEGAVQ